MSTANKQLQRWAVCQLSGCGAVIAADKAEADGWLVSVYRVNPDLKIIRCFRHWSEWAMRMSVHGRTVEGRQKMVAGRERAAGEVRMNPYAEPFPFSDEDRR